MERRKRQEISTICGMVPIVPVVKETHPLLGDEHGLPDYKLQNTSATFETEERAAQRPGKGRPSQDRRTWQKPELTICSAPDTADGRIVSDYGNMALDMEADRMVHMRDCPYVLGLAWVQGMIKND
ncbi:hypothetical protein N7532_009222 [Penicillium argentinense]|uniref:Uncharacterized protein n=1 Tax=Penicillium argentinense TaxID=1131581 RepID=A0A9W9K2E0_9EURO|nr:uncharacterized protein N7532_009222 [Penicillium argentinense]KAJ5090538.1 hypothetical protein N7532_009222 [Penicillium argentinense]